jgi:hypothetical protein
MEHIVLSPATRDIVGHLAWRPPTIVRDATALDDDLESIPLAQLRQIEELERQLEHWISKGRAKRERLWRNVTGKKASPQVIEHLTTSIETLEHNCLEEAEDLARLRKEFRRDHRRASRSSKAVLAILEDTDNRILRAHERALQERLDFALFLRACRAELDPDASGGETFENPADLERHLRSFLSS